MQDGVRWRQGQRILLRLLEEKHIPSCEVKTYSRPDKTWLGMRPATGLENGPSRNAMIRHETSWEEIIGVPRAGVAGMMQEEVKRFLGHS